MTHFSSHGHMGRLTLKKKILRVINEWSQSYLHNLIIILVQVLKLKEQLCDAQKEIQRLERCTDGASSNSPSTSFSVEPMEPPPFLGEFGMDAAGFENLFHFSGNGYVHGMEWVNSYI